MLEDLTGIKNVDVEDCNKFLISIDKDKNGKIDREELSDFIFHGMLLSQEDRLQYSQQGRLHDTIMQFFAGVDKARELFNKKGKDALDEYMEDIADPSIKVKEIRAYVER